MKASLTIIIIAIIILLIVGIVAVYFLPKDGFILSTIPIYKGSQLQDEYTATLDDDIKGLGKRYKFDGSRDDLRDYYKDKLGDSGWKIDKETISNIESTPHILIYEKRFLVFKYMSKITIGGSGQEDIYLLEVGEIK